MAQWFQRRLNQTSSILTVVPWTKWCSPALALDLTSRVRMDMRAHFFDKNQAISVIMYAPHAKLQGWLLHLPLFIYSVWFKAEISSCYRLLLTLPIRENGIIHSWTQSSIWRYIMIIMQAISAQRSVFAGTYHLLHILSRCRMTMVNVHFLYQRWIKRRLLLLY